MKILLIQPKMNWHHPYCESPSIALLTLGALAKGCGHEVKVVHRDIDRVEFNELALFKPDIIGITCNTFQVKDVRYLVSQAKGFGARIVLGGPHAVAWNKETDGEVDDIVIGEGENKWLEILGQPPIDDINDLPFPDYSLVNLNHFTGISPVGGLPSMAIMASRGCPGQCIFCNTPTFWGSKVRRLTPDRALQHIQLLHKNYGAQEVFIQDDTFNADQDWAKEILSRIISSGLNRTVVFRLACRANEKMMSEEFVKLAAKAGVWNIFLGIESGSQVILDNIKKHISIEENRRAIKLIQDNGIKAQTSFIVGLPGETLDTLAETKKFIKDTKPYIWGACHATPFPSTIYDRWVTERGYKKQVDYADYQYGAVLTRTEALDYEDFEKTLNVN